MTPEILRRIFTLLDFENPLHLVCWTIFVVSFFSFLRKSNLVPDSAEQAQSGQCHFLRRRDILVLRDSAILTIRSSKTDNFQERPSVIPLAAIDGSTLCPVYALRLMITRIPASLSEPAFLIPSDDGRSKYPVTYSSLLSLLKSCIAKLGLNPQDYAMHSFRRGGCTLAHQLGVDPDSIKIHGKWRSDAYQAYLKQHLQKMLQVSKVMAAGTHDAVDRMV
jgi:hypothetical protein